MIEETTNEEEANQPRTSEANKNKVFDAWPSVEATTANGEEQKVLQLQFRWRTSKSFVGNLMSCLLTARQAGCEVSAEIRVTRIPLKASDMSEGNY